MSDVLNIDSQNVSYKNIYKINYSQIAWDAINNIANSVISGLKNTYENPKFKSLAASLRMPAIILAGACIGYLTHSYTFTPPRALGPSDYLTRLIPHINAVRTAYSQFIHGVCFTAIGGFIGAAIGAYGELFLEEHTPSDSRIYD
ncbi:MAG: hypothetical protein H7A40_07365 [Chlamydiales bacterium]|nr:hypothetical protein [Chlamydiales bacterium]